MFLATKYKGPVGDLLADCQHKGRYNFTPGEPDSGCYSPEAHGSGNNFFWHSLGGGIERNAKRGAEIFLG
jgi:hypothetical protein